MLSRDDFVDFQEQGIPLPKNTHGGRRAGAGRKPRQDARKSLIIRVALTDHEHLQVLTLTPDQRRKALLAALN